MATDPAPGTDKPPAFAAVPLASLPPEAAQDTAPKRRRGRQPRDPNAPAVTRRPRARKTLEPQIGAMLMTFNFAFMVIPPIRNDALDEAEIVALAKAIDQQAQSSPTFHKYLKTMLDATSGGQLVSVVAIIAARRLARHEIGLPMEADAALGGMLEQITKAPSLVPPRDDDQDAAASDDGGE